MRKLAYFAALLPLVGCAGPGTRIQSQCEAGNPSSFVAMYECTRDGIKAQHPDILSDPRGKLYMLKGEQLAGQVKAGKLTDLDARVEWQQLFVNLKQAKDAEEMQLLANMPKARQPVNCTTTSLGGVTQTSCQ